MSRRQILQLSYNKKETCLEIFTHAGNLYHNCCETSFIFKHVINSEKVWREKVMENILIEEIKIAKEKII